MTKPAMTGHHTEQPNRSQLVPCFGQDFFKLLKGTDHLRGFRAVFQLIERLYNAVPIFRELRGICTPPAIVWFDILPRRAGHQQRSVRLSFQYRFLWTSAL